MIIRRYDHQRDRDSLLRMFREVGWAGREKEKEPFFDSFASASRGFVAEHDGAAECAVLMFSGMLRYQQGELPFAGVAGVTTSRVARRQGLASRTTAMALADAALRGAALAGLGMFDQGYYNQLGFGTMAYEHWVTLDPATLRVPVRARPPVRITVEDAEAAHSGRLTRLRPHGGVAFNDATFTRTAMQEADNGFGLGYRDGDRITHHFWAEAKGEQGPYSVWWLAYETTDQLLELLALMHNLSDQVHHLEIQEPPQIQIQDLLEWPFRQRARSRRAEHENRMSSDAGYQVRILDLAACVAALEARAELEFNLQLHDPVARFLPEDGWRGTTGEYVVRLGASSTATPGSDPGLPTLRAGVGAFSRVWLGVRPAVSVAITDDLSGPPELLAELDAALALPEPHFNWGF
jgi:predicted N-acetyltransferase YhbS